MAADSDPDRAADAAVLPLRKAEGEQTIHGREDANGSAGPRLPRERTGAEGAADAPRDDGRASGEPAVPGIGAALLRFAEETFGAVDALLTVQVDRAKLAMRRTVTTAVIAGGSAIVLLFGACAAALALVRGVCGAFTALAGGRAWVGELAGGALALLLFAVVVALVLHITNRRELARLEAKYGRKQPRNEVDAAAQSNDPRRAAHDR